MKKKKNQTAIVIVIFVLGLLILLYPFVSSWYNDNQLVAQVKAYEDEVSNIDPTYAKAEFKKAQEYNDSLRGDPVKDPFVPGSGRALPENYTSILNYNGMMGVLEIPEINVNLPIQHGSSEEVLKRAIGHMEGTSLPIGSKGGHALLTGHTGLPDATLLTDLTKLKVGSEFYIKILGREFVYEVDDIQIILPEEFEKVDLSGEEEFVTLVTCTPYGVNSHRLLVRGRRVSTINKTLHIGSDRSWLYYILFAVCISGMIFTSVVLIRSKKRQQLQESKKRGEENKK